MKYTIQSSKYVTKNFFYIFLFALIPALFLSLSTDQKSMAFVLDNLFAGTLENWNFVDLFRSISVLNFASLKSVGFGFLGVVSIVFCGALITALLEKHMRIGKRTFNGVFARLNDNLAPTFIYMLFLLLIYELWSLITAALLFFVSRIAWTALSYAFSVGVFIGMNVVLLYLIGVVYLWLPCMQITGFRAVEALIYVNRIAAPTKGQILIGQLCVLVFSEALICVCVALTSSFWGFTLLTTALYAIMIMVYCVRMYVVYFDVEHIERADENKYY